MTDGYIICPKHGDLYMQPGADPTTPIAVEELIPLQNVDASAKWINELRSCPICQRKLKREIREPTEVVILGEQ